MMNHYRYLEEHIDAFWQRVLDRKPVHADTIYAHGNEGYGFKKGWQKEGIHFHHAMMLYLLTYTELMDRPEHRRYEWVIDNYPFYAHLLPDAKIPYIALYNTRSGVVTKRFVDNGQYATAFIKYRLEVLSAVDEGDTPKYITVRYIAINS